MLLFKCKTSDILLFQWYSILKTILFHLWLALTCFLKLALECFFTAQYWQEYSTPSRWVLSKCSIIWLCRKNQSKLSFSISLINISRHAGFYFLMLFREGFKKKYGNFHKGGGSNPFRIFFFVSSIQPEMHQIFFCIGGGTPEK